MMFGRRLVFPAVLACIAINATPAIAKTASHSAQTGSYRVVDRISAADGGWDFANIDSVRGRLYIARSDAITVVDLASRKVTDRLVSAHKGHQVLVLDDGKTIFETDGATDLGRFISATDGTILAEIPTGKKPDAALLDPHTGLIAVMNAGDGSVTLLNPTTRSLVGTIAVGGSLEFGVADGTGRAFVNIEDANAIAIVDLVSMRRTGSIALPGCEGPTGLASINQGSRLIAACANQLALVVDTVSGKVVSRLSIGLGPDAVLVDELRHRAFIPCGGSGTLVEIAIDDPKQIRVVGTITTQIGARTGAVDPRDGRIYLPTATFAPPPPGGKHGKAEPGTFGVLVVAPTS